MYKYVFFFFFQAEDGIRDLYVTGVQTCALPIYRGPVRLPLPADQSTPIIFDRQLVAGHGSTVPGAIGKPRKKAGASSGARPGRCTRSNRKTPSPQATDKCSSSTVPGTPPAGPGKS